MTTTGVTLRWPDDQLPAELAERLVGPGAPFELVVEDVLGVALPVFARRPRNLRELLVSGAERFATRPYLVFPDRELTFGQVPGPVAAVARVLQDRYGVAKGDRVAIVAANCLEYTLTFWAATVLGAVTVALNGWWTGPEMTYALELSTPTVVCGDARRLERLGGRVPGDVPVVVFEEDFAGIEAAGAGADLPTVAIDEDDPFLIQFTSGTTGRPKGALVSHRGNIHFILASLLRGAEGALRRPLEDGPAPPPATGLPCVVSGSPLFHISGLNAQLVMATATGMTIVYPPPGKWREDIQLELTERYRATNWSLVPTQLWRILDWPDLHRYDLSSLTGIGGGSAVWPPELLRRVEQQLPAVRPGLGTGYGMTETNGLGTSLRSARTYDRPDSIGEPSPTMEIQVRDPLTEEALPEGVVGEICLRSAATFLRYWENPAATEACLDGERWYRTGDHGLIRDGFVYLEGRRHDLIIRGGENIYPAEIENRLIEHPAVAEVAVVGVEHPKLGQEVKAYVVCHPDAATSAEDLRAFAGTTLSSFKVPAYVEFLDQLPHNPTGKVLKHLLGQPTASGGFVDD